jgi:hypothetical protein
MNVWTAASHYRVIYTSDKGLSHHVSHVKFRGSALDFESFMLLGYRLNRRSKVKSAAQHM